MFVIGAVHIAQPLAPMAAMAGYEVTIIDPRRSFATAARFPGVTITHDWPDEAMDKLSLNARTAVITLTHDPKIDDPALDRALRSDCFYIGCLGSTRTHKARLGRLAEAGFGEKDFARIHGPVGLDIGAKSPAEIAISIMAEVTAELRREPAGDVAAAAA
jgi:xanthine dehydrogenase accessory factor